MTDDGMPGTGDTVAREPPPGPRTPIRAAEGLLAIKPVLVGADDPLDSVIQRAASAPSTRVLGVVDGDGILVGVVIPHDLVAAVVGRLTPGALLTQMWSTRCTTSCAARASRRRRSCRACSTRAGKLARGDGRARLREPLVRARGSVADLRRHRVRGDGQPAHRRRRTRSPTSSIPRRSMRRQLNAYAGVLDEVGDYATCEKIANHLLRVAGDDVMWKTNAWNHLACAYIGLGKLRRGGRARRARGRRRTRCPTTPPAFAATLERAQHADQDRRRPPPHAAPREPREPVFALLEAGDFAAAAALLGDRELARAACRARRRRASGSRRRTQVEVTPRARAAAVAVLAETIGIAGSRSGARAARSRSDPRAGVLRARSGAAARRSHDARRVLSRVPRARRRRPRRGRAAAAAVRRSRRRARREGRARERLRRAAPRSRGADAARGARAVRPRRGGLPRGRASAWAAAMAADPSVAQSIAAGLAKR